MTLFFRRSRDIIFINTTTLHSIRSSLPPLHTWLLSTRSLLTSPPKKPKKDVRLINSALATVHQEPDLRVLVEEFKKFSSDKWFPRYTNAYLHCGRRLAREMQFSWIEEIVEEQKKYLHIRREKFMGTLMRMYVDAKMWDQARKLFDEMPQLNCERGAFSCNSFFKMSLYLERFVDAEKIFREIFEKNSVKPNLVSYNTLLMAYSKKGSWKRESWREVLDQMERNRVDPTNTTFDRIVDMLFQSRHFEEAENAMRMMKKYDLFPSAKNFHSKIKALILQKNMAEALLTYQDLRVYYRVKGVKPLVNTFNAFIDAYCYAGDLGNAKKWYNELHFNYTCPNKATFRKFVPCVYQMGDFWYAFKLCNKAVELGYDLGEELFQLVVDAVVRNGWIKLVGLFVENVETEFDYQLKLPWNQTDEIDQQ